MLTVDRIAKVDSLIGTLLAALYRTVERLADKHEALVVNAAYKLAEAKAAAIAKAEDKIFDLEDDRAELVAYGVEAKVILQQQYRTAMEALAKELEAKDDKITKDLAAAAEAMVAATKAYDDTAIAVADKLGVEVNV